MPSNAPGIMANRGFLISLKVTCFTILNNKQLFQKSYEIITNQTLYHSFFWLNVEKKIAFDFRREKLMMIFHYMINVNVSLSKKDLPGGRSGGAHAISPQFCDNGQG